MNKLLELAPKREDFPSQEAYEDARAFFRHQMRGVIRPRSSGSPEKSPSQDETPSSLGRLLPRDT
jgi:hypothetical protein